MTILALLPALLKIVTLCLQEFFRFQKEAEEKKVKFEISDKLTLAVFQKALEKFKQQTIADNQQVGDIQDRMDEEIAKGGHPDDRRKP